MRGRGQSVVELAVALPVVLALAFGAAAVVRVADAKSGLDGATAAAVADAARQASAASAAVCAQRRFQAVAAGYGLISPQLQVSGSFDRGSIYSATATAQVDISFVPLGFLPRSVGLQAHAQSRAEPWRSRSGQPCGGLLWGP